MALQLFSRHLYFFVYFRGEEFRTDFKDLSALKALFPTVPIMALTATAPPLLLTNLKQSLSLQKGSKVVAANPNRSNIYYDKKMRMSNHHGYESYDRIVIPIAKELAVHRKKYPMTIIYLKLKYCGYVYGLFEQILQDKQFVGDTKDPAGRLFAQFHAPQTKRMKKSLIAEVKKENSRARVLFATSALGMGVNIPHVEHVVHITPPSNIESYMQETGRAGKTGVPSKATLYYNNSDIAKNKEHVQDPMKEYCKSQTTCLRKLILEYLGFPGVTQERCCCVCDATCTNVVNKLPSRVKRKVRAMPTENKAVLEELIFSVLNEFEAHTSVPGENFFMLFSFSHEKNVLPKIMEGIDYIETESDLLDDYKIWNETCSSKIFSFISKYAPLIEDNTCDTYND